MIDIVERLRSGEKCPGSPPCQIRDAASGCDCAENADEIERLREEIERLREEIERLREQLDAAEQDVALAELRAALEQHEPKP